MILGFTGTSKHDMPTRQLVQVRRLLDTGCYVLHLGDCIHADTQAYWLAKAISAWTVGHPPTDPRARAFLHYDQELSAKPYLDRNLDIAVQGANGLIAAPSGFTEVLRSGTWSTVRYARKKKRHIWIVWPDGTVKEES